MASADAESGDVEHPVSRFPFRELIINVRHMWPVQSIVNRKRPPVTQHFRGSFRLVGVTTKRMSSKYFYVTRLNRRYRVPHVPSLHMGFLNFLFCPSGGAPSFLRVRFFPCNIPARSAVADWRT